MAEVETLRSSETLPWGLFAASENVFFSRAYVSSWIEHLASGDVEVAVEREGSEIARAYPIVRCSERILGKQVDVWKSLGWNSAWYPYSFLPPTAEGIAPFLDYLVKSSRSWEGVLISCPAEYVGEVESVSRERGLSTTLWSEKTLPHVPVAGTWKDYWSGREKWLRVNVGRYEKRADKEGRVELRKVGTAEECRTILSRFVSLHDARWSARGQRSKYVTRDRHRRFLEDVTLRALEEGILYFPYLALDDEPIAMAVCFVDRGKLYYVWPTFDVDYSRLSPGKLLLYHIIRDAFELGLDEVDLGPGADEYKFYWTGEKRKVAQLLLYRTSLRLWGAYHVMPRFRSRVRLGLERVLGDERARRVAGALDRAGLGGS